MPRRRRRKKSRMTLGKKIRLFVFLFIVPLMLGAGAGGYLALERGVPSLDELKHYRTAPSTKIYADDDVLIGELKLQKGKYVPLEKVPEHLINAVVAVEDSNFWKHSGIDYLAIARAAFKDILSRHLKEGGSTITQQLAKITFLTPEKTLKRKLREIVLAMKIEKNLTKQEILELYLNRVYFGHGAYGVEMASRVYFGKSVSEITLPEAALLAGLLKAPSTYSPFNDIKRAKDRQKIVLRRMEEEGYISRKLRLEAEKTSIYLSRARRNKGEYNYFIGYVRKYLEEKYGADAIYKGGLRVYTTLDRHAQMEAQRALREGLRAIDKRRGFRGPIGHRNLDEEKAHDEGAFRSMPPNVGDIVTGVVLSVKKRVAEIKTNGIKGTLSLEDAAWASNVFDTKTQTTKKIKWFNLKKILKPGDVIKVKVKSIEGGKAEFALEQEPEVQGALVAVDPNSGFIRALVGGYDYSKSEYNRALYAKRQVGSAFKPIIYAVALKNGFTPASIIVDEPVTYENGPDNIWTPKNYDEEFHGPTRLRDALAYSRNVVTVKIVDEIGIGRVIDFATAIGINRKDIPRNLSIALGSLSITPLELTMCYTVFANGGMKMKPIGVKYVTDRRGRVLENNAPEGIRVLDPQTAFLITSMMKDVVNYGTGWRVRALGRPVAGKTGTTNDYRDAWFLGYTTDLVAGVWVGFDDPRPLGEEETGSRAASPIWLDFMRAVSDNTEPRDFPVPEGIVTRLIDPETGLLANRWTVNAVLEYFKAGTEPRESSPTIWEIREPENILFY